MKNTTIQVTKELKTKLSTLKYKYDFKNLNQLILKLYNLVLESKLLKRDKN